MRHPPTVSVSTFALGDYDWHINSSTNAPPNINTHGSATVLPTYGTDNGSTHNNRIVCIRNLPGPNTSPNKERSLSTVPEEHVCATSGWLTPRICPIYSSLGSSCVRHFDTDSVCWDSGTWRIAPDGRSIYGSPFGPRWSNKS